MKIQKYSTKLGPSFLLLDDSYLIIKPVSDFIEYLHTKGMSFNTRRTYIRHIKLFYEFIELKGYTIKSIFEQEDKNAISILLNFIEWLKTEPRKIDKNSGHTLSKKRTVRTVTESSLQLRAC